VVGPLLQVLRCEATHAKRAVRLAIVGAAFAIPIVRAFVVENASAMGIDMLARVVFPNASVHGGLGEEWHARELQRKKRGEKLVHGKFIFLVIIFIARLIIIKCKFINYYIPRPTIIGKK